MVKLRPGSVLGLLGMLSLPACAAPSVEETARQVMIGFQNEDAKLLNSLTDKDIGLYVLFRRGVSMDYEHLTQIDFNQPVPEYLRWPSGGEHIPRDEEFDRKTTPHFECEGGWDRKGYFISGYDAYHQLSANMVWTRRDRGTVSDADIAAARNLEFNSVRVVAVPTRSSDGLVFYLSQAHGFQGTWYLTVVDQIIDCGA